MLLTLALDLTLARALAQMAKADPEVKALPAMAAAVAVAVVAAAIVRAAERALQANTVAA